MAKSKKTEQRVEVETPEQEREQYATPPAKEAARPDEQHASATEQPTLFDGPTADERHDQPEPVDGGGPTREEKYDQAKEATRG